MRFRNYFYHNLIGLNIPMFSCLCLYYRTINHILTKCVLVRLWLFVMQTQKTELNKSWFTYLTRGSCMIVRSSSNLPYHVGIVWFAEMTVIFLSSWYFCQIISKDLWNALKSWTETTVDWSSGHHIFCLNILIHFCQLPNFFYSMLRFLRHPLILSLAFSVD